MMVGGLTALVLAVHNDTAWFITLALMFLSALLTVTLLAVYFIRRRRSHTDVARRLAATQSEVAALRTELTNRRTS